MSKLYSSLIGAGIIIVIIGLVWWRWDVLATKAATAERERDAWKLQYDTEKLNKELAEELAKTQETELVTLRNKKQEVVIHKEVQIEYITRYRDNPNVGTCGIPGEWVYQYNAAAGLSELSPYRPGTDPTRERTYDDQIVLEVVVDNVHNHHEAVAQHTALVNAVNNSIVVFNKKVEEINAKRRKQ